MTCGSREGHPVPCRPSQAHFFTKYKGGRDKKPIIAKLQIIENTWILVKLQICQKTQLSLDPKEDRYAKIISNLFIRLIVIHDI
jgi:hypothetical protein